MEPQTILKETNNAIQADKGILEEHLPIVVQGFKQLRSGDFEVHTEKVEHVEIRQAATDWVTVLEQVQEYKSVHTVYLYTQYAQRVWI